jgi:uncharacterized protein YbaP (TraB family)
MQSLIGSMCGLALLAAPMAARAQDAEQEIVVQARLSGAPMWEVTRGKSVVLLVGEIIDVPEATPWRPEQLEGATARANSVVLGIKTSVSPGDMFRVLFHMGRITNFPKGQDPADYLSPSQQQRLAALEQATGKSYRKRSFMVAAYSLLRERLKYSDDTMKDASDIVRKAAKQAKIPVRPVGELKGKDLIDSLFTAAPATQVVCLDTAMTAVEAGPAIVAARGDAWTRFDVPAVMASPLEIALGSCWPWTDERFGPELRGQWSAEIGHALDQPEVTLAVVPLRILAEEGGLLDQLKAQELAIKGPAWRK